MVGDTLTLCLPALPLSVEEVYFHDLSFFALQMAPDIVFGGVIGAVECLAAVVVDEHLLVAVTLSERILRDVIAINF